MMLALLATLAAMPQPGEIKTFQDWTVGCDNGRACQAVGLIPEDGWDGYITMRLTRGAEADAQPAFAIVSRDGAPASIATGGRKLPVRLTGGEGEALVDPADAQKMVEILRTQPVIEVLDAAGAMIGRVSLAGASAALLYMDEQQQRGGTSTAFVRPGTRPASAAPPPPALPQVRDGTRGRRKAAPLTAAREAELRRQVGCEIGEVGGPAGGETFALDRRHTLILLPCGSGAYNVSSIALISTGSGRRAAARLAAFDLNPALGDVGLPFLVNADWGGGRLVTFSKGRGLGDCGTSSTYAWDGARFRLVEQAEMHECRGSIDYIPTWRAEVVR